MGNFLLLPAGDIEMIQAGLPHFIQFIHLQYGQTNREPFAFYQGISVFNFILSSPDAW